MVIIAARGIRRVLALHACVFQFQETDPNGTSSRRAAAPLTPSHPATVMMDISIAICKHMASESSGIIVPVHEHALTAII